jgi:hypothetical protein
MNSTEIERLLLEKHSKDFCARQMKTGRTIGAETHAIFDVWAMEMSWKDVTHGYEIKVNRNDFIGDTKWTYYLDYCHQFSWVCPEGLIKKSEVDDRVGLIYAYPDGRLRVVKKALHRDVRINPSIYRYALLTRTSAYIPHNRASQIRLYLKNKDASLLSHEFKSELVKENQKLKLELEQLKRKIELDALMASASTNSSNDSVSKQDWINSLNSILTKVQHELIRAKN